MNKRYTGLLAFAFPAAMFAQQNNFPAHLQDKHLGGNGKHVIQVSPSSLEKAGSSFYSEDFDAGLNGWTLNTIEGQVDWEHTSTGPETTNSTYPVPALNSSTPAGWIMIDDDFDGEDGLNTEAHLVSPVINLSLAPTALKVEFEQFFQEWENDHCYVGVSTDGGTTWNEVEVNEGAGRDGRPNPELVDIDITAMVAGDPSNVMLRFKYVSTWDYGWQIDNVAIKELPANDMAILQAHYNSFDFDLNGLANIEYSIYPQSQIMGLNIFANIKNKGAVIQTDVTLNVDATEPGGNTNYSSTPEDVNVGDTISPVISGYTPSGDIGSYTIDFSVTQNEGDDLPANNTASRSFMVSEAEFAMDLGTCSNTIVQGPDHIGAQFEVGNYFEITNDGDQMHSILVAVSDSSVVGSLVYGIVYDINMDIVELTDDYEIEVSDLNDIGGSLFICIPLPSPIDLISGEIYLAMAGYYGGPDDLQFCTSGISPAQVSILRYPNTDENFYVTLTPMVRMGLNTCEGVGIDEMDITGINIMEPIPNPFTNTSMLEFKLLRSSKLSVMLMDITGKVVRLEDLGRFPQGTSTFKIERKGLSAGIYTIELRTESGSSSRKLVITD